MCNATINYWARDSNLQNNVTIAQNVYYKAPEAKAERLVYSTKISGLDPDTLYDFEISYFDIRANNQKLSSTKSFRTFPNDPEEVSNFSVAFGGDIGNLNDTLAMHEVVATRNPYAVFVGGDLAHDRGFQE